MKRVVLIGSGNVATNLAYGLSQASCCEVAEVYSRRLSHARVLADAVGCPKATDDLSALMTDADAYLIAVSDDAIAGVLEAVPDNGALWVHTSGSKPISLFAGLRSRYGVLWPMQSLSREMVVPLGEVPFFAEGGDESALADVMALGNLLSQHVVAARSDQRLRLHMASVFANNFANHMWTLASEVLADAGLSHEVLLPLIRTTVGKLDRLTPAASQTGPAVRNDREVIERHLAMLEGDKREIYELITRSIIERNSC